MPTDISADSFNDLLPDSISFDPQVQAIGMASDAALRILYPLIDNVRVLSNIPSLPESVLDLLAFQFNVLFYTQATNIADPVQRLAVKRSFIARSFDFNSRLGTPELVQTVIAAIYQNVVIQDWIHYGGTAHHFRILTDNVINDPVIISNIIGTLNIVKRKSSYFDGFFTNTPDVQGTVYLAVGVFAEEFIALPIAH